MQYTGQLQQINLTYLEQGHLMVIVLTNVADIPKLEFKHAGDTTWRTHPGFSGTITNGVVIQEVRCISGTMRLNFADAPASPYFLSVVDAEDPSL
jgi:hypothetical protein